jgi:phenylalanyl-tRNA synthetase alpha chain
MLTQRTASYMPGLVGRRGATPLRRASKIAAKAAAAPPKYITEDVGNNVTPYIENLVGRGLHRAEAHPLGIIKAKIEEYFQGLDGPAFEIVDDLDPLVQAQACFDDLLIPKDHPGRLPSDTYYVSRPGGRELSASTDVLLRTHTSAHQSQLLRDGKEAFLCTGDVYRRDEIDASHFPAFHQMEGVKLFPPADVGGAMTREEWLASPGCELIAKDLKKTLEGLCDHLFGDCEKRWIDEYFPFTEPSFELEIYYNGDWMEVLGCGVVHSGVLENVGLSDRHGWAFGLGLERLAMVLFSIPDIRLFWTDDTRFTKQFKPGQLTTFKPYSKYPPCFKDIAFWIPDGFEPNDFFELGRAVAGELVEKVDLIDEFTNPKKAKTSHCYRITYRSMDRSLTDDEVNKMQEDLRERAANELAVELR